MYSACIFCHRDLGSNEVVETFPVGRRLAFDAAKGRLWVVCRRCGRWNLSPLEERWEAIEDCERLFRNTRLRVSTANVGMARLRDGTDLVRVGAPERPEFAAWRFGDQFVRRRRRNLIYMGAAIAVGVPLLATGAYNALAAVIPGGGTILQIPSWIEIYRAKRGVVARTTTRSGERALIRGKHVRHARLVPGDDAGGWHLRVRHDSGFSDVQGAEAFQLAGRLLARINQAGGGTKSVRLAVDRLEHEGGGERLFQRIAGASGDRHVSRAIQSWPGTAAGNYDDAGGVLRSLDLPSRLALEMATHEETERQALEGELGVLEKAWREAEEIASIADSLTLPPGIESFLTRHGRGRRKGDG